MGNINSVVKGSFCIAPAEHKEDSSEEEKRESSNTPVVRSIKESVEERKKVPSVTSQPFESEIIIKCSVEEMMKAFFKDYVIVWHDPDTESQENQQHIAQLKKFCEVFTFTEWEKAKDYIKTSQAVCHVITSGTNGELLAKETSHSENVCNIYIFCKNKEYHSAWAQNYPKVSCIETDIQNLINHIHQNLLEWYKKASSLNFSLPAFAPIFNDSDKSEMNHLHLYLKVIPNFESREQAKSDFLALSKVIYTDPNNQRLLVDFEANYNAYNKEQTLRWYTLESFLYKVTNNCLRIATSDSIQYCRLALKDIEQAIKDQYQAKSKNFNGLLYRGAYLSQEEWLSLKENQDKEIEMLGFLSVSKVKNVALHFMEQNLNKMALITIIVPQGPNEEEQGLAEIEDYSRYPQEKEILFNVRSRFTVLEAEDDYAYSETLKCRHLVLLYGAQGFRKSITEQNPVQEKLIASSEDPSCTRCHVKSERALFVSLADSQNQTYYYCKACTDYGAGPFLYIDKVDISYIAKINGCLLLNSNQQQTPFYGYKCDNCQAKKQKAYFTCTDCNGKRFCHKCFEEETFPCLQAKHSLILEKTPYSFWCEGMSQNELNHLKFQQDLVQKGGDCFQQASMYVESHEYEKAIQYYKLYIQQNGVSGVKDATSYNNLGTVYDNQGEYKKAINCYLKAIDIDIAVYGENHPSVGASYSNLAGAYSKVGEDAKAIEYYLRSLEIVKSVYGDNHPDTATCYNNIGLAYMDQRDYEKALQYYLVSLDIVKSVYGDNHLYVAGAYNNLAGVYEKQEEHEKALEYHLKSLEFLKAVYGDNHPNVAISYNNIGLVYSKQGEHQKALEYYLMSLEIRKSVYGGDNHPEIATSCNNIGLLYSKQGEHQKATEYFLKSLDIRKSVYGGHSHPEVARSYNNLAVTYEKQGEYNQALEYHLIALDIYKSFYGDNHPDIATSYNNIGSAYNKQEEYNKAIEYYFKSLDIRKSLYGDNHPDLAACYNNIATVYSNQEEYNKALEYYLKCLDIRKSLYGDNHPDLAASYDTIGQVYKNLGETEKAIEYYLKSLEIQKSIHGENYSDVAIVYNDLARKYHSEGEYTQALEYYLKSIEIQKSLYGDNHPDLALSYNNMGLIYDSLGEYDKALEYYLECLNIQKSINGDNHQNVALAYENVGNASYRQGKTEKALEYFFKSLDIYKAIYGDDNHPDLADSYSNIGSVYYNQGETKKALEYFLKTLDIKKSVYGDNHPNIAAGYSNLGTLCLNHKEYDDALGYFFNSLEIYVSVYEDDNHPDIATTFNNIGVVYCKKEEYDEALECLLKSLEIKLSVYGEDHPEAIKTQEVINIVQSIMNPNEP